MKGIIKRLFNKRTTKQKPLGKIVVGVKFELKASTSIIK